jgi:hypothetical protein
VSEKPEQRDQRSAARLWAALYSAVENKGFQRRGVDVALARRWKTRIQRIQKLKTGVSVTPFYLCRDLLAILKALGSETHLEDALTASKSIKTKPEDFLSELKRSEK